MPSPSASRHRGSIVRQLSLQSQPSGQPPAGRRGLKKQMSEDDGRSRTLDAVEVTGQGWPVAGEKPEAGLRAGSNEGQKIGQQKTASRPRPIKMAWADRKQESTERPIGVEVVARKCPGQPRPTTIKAQRTTNLPLLGDKETLAYSRQQFAERLRIAWREREKNKPNLNIFLARAAETARSGREEANTDRSSELTEVKILAQDSITFRSVSTADGSVSSDPIERPENPAESNRKSILKNVHLKNDAEEKTGEEDSRRPAIRLVTDCPDFQTFPVSEPTNGFGNNLTNIDYRVKSPCVARKPCNAERLSKDKENNSPRSDSGYSEGGKTGKLDEEANPTSEVVEESETRPHATAQERRASFRSGGLLNRAIDESYSPSGTNSSEEIEDDFPQEGNNEIKVFLRKNDDKRPPLTRTLSAPTRNEAHSPKTASGSAAPKTTVVSFKDLPHQSSEVDLAGIYDDLTALRGRVKSAPIRRKLKTTAARRKQRGKEADSSDDEKQSEDQSKRRGARRKAMARMSASDIVTMVSLVSPAESDAEENAIPLPEETWVEEEKEEKEADAQSEKVEPPKEISSFIIQKFVSLRKSNKTVSFVQHPPVSRSYSASFPSRRAPAGTPIIIPTPVITNPALTPAQLQEREKRPQPPSPGLAAGTDNRGVKRRLIRTASAPQVKENGTNESRDSDGKAEEKLADLPRKDFDKIEESNEDEEKEDDKKEPEFKSPKEKECWVLYQKMLEKGVSVSFDTVLRGMLTPTEYRLRRNQLLSSC
ncbi:UNVERIFIED_CONTAM: hypothetical protein PYX00_001215 [Menopon gallinae]|uniref:Uncharacterized protein n=1 Tax=Menopon gallinae TaxID=328185 RepID=A0AAW2IBX6_9NEOP